MQLRTGVIWNIYTAMLISVIDKISTAKSITFTGGEPMLHKGFYELIEYTKNNFSGALGLITNGTLIDEKNIDFIVNNFDSISISVDAASNTKGEQDEQKSIS